MAAKIRLETDNATRPGFDAAVAGLKEMADKAGITTNAAKELSKALDKQKYAEFRAEVARVTAEMQGTAKAMAQTGREAQNLNAELKNAKGAGMSFADIGGVIATVKAAYQGLKFQAQQVYDLYKSGADAGIKSSKQLVDSVEGMAAAWERAQVKFASTDTGGRWATWIADLVSKTGEVVEEAGGGFNKTTTAVVLLGNEIGVVSDEYRKSTLAAARFNEQSLKAAVDEAQRFKDRNANSEFFASRDAARAAAERKEADEKIESLTEITKLIRDQERLMEEAAEQPGDNSVIREQAIKRINELEQRRAAIRKEGVEAAAKAEKEAAAKAEKEAKEFADRQSERRKREAAAMRDINQRNAADQKAIEDARIKALAQVRAAEQEMWDAEDARLQKLKGDLGGEETGKKLLGMQDPRKIREAYAKNRVAKELEDFDRGNAGRTDAAAVARERQAAGRAARTNAFKQFNRGGARDEDVMQATNDAAQTQISEMKARGSLDGQTVTALRQLTEAAAKSQAEAKNTDMQIEKINDALAAILAAQGGGGRRGRAQGAAE